MSLTAKQNVFIKEYLVDLNATQAALRAGYAQSTASKKAPLWVGKSRSSSPKPHVWDAVQRSMGKRSSELEVTAKEVVAQLASIGMVGLDDEKMLSGQVKVGDKLRALELLAKHLGMFTERVSMETKVDLASILRQAKERALANRRRLSQGQS